MTLTVPAVNRTEHPDTPSALRILLLHPNYHSGGAEIAGNWPPAWVAYLSGALKAAGFANIRFIDAMTDHIDDEALEAILREERPAAARSAASPTCRTGCRPRRRRTRRSRISTRWCPTGAS